jgi:hypothetical protein
MVGLAWARTTAEWRGPNTVRDRTGVFVEIPLGLGLACEVVPDWVRLSASGNLGLLTLQSGNLFESVQSFDDGSMTQAPPLPRFKTSWTAVAGVGVLL